MRKIMKKSYPDYLVIYKNEITGEIKVFKLLNNSIEPKTSIRLFEIKYNNRINTQLYSTYIPNSVKTDLEEGGTLDYIRDMYNQTVYYSKRKFFANITISLN